MTTIQQVLDKKGHEVLSVRPDNSVFEAIKKMADRDVGSVVVIDDGKPVGIFTERHYARKVFLEGRASPTTRVGDIMETRVACARPEQTVEECMAVMTEKRIRHLPVLHHKKLVGLISIGDLVKSKIADQEFTIEQLVDYVRG
jgi:CBS domain-containing protein